MRIHRSILPTALLALAALPLAAQDAPPRATVAVIDFTASALASDALQDAAASDAVGKSVAGMIATELSGRPGIRVIERQQLQNLLQEQKLALSGRVDDATAVQIGKLLGANYILKGVVVLWGKSARLDLQIVDVETGEQLDAQKANGKPDGLLDMVTQLTDQFARSLKLEVPAQRPPAPEVPFGASINYGRGLDYEDKGQPDKAIEMYRKALEVYPEHREAKAALERLEKKGGSR